MLVPAARNRIDLYKTASTDQYGRFTFSNVAHGDYRVFAWEDIPQGAYMDAAYVARFEDRGIAARVEKGPAKKKGRAAKKSSNGEKKAPAKKAARIQAAKSRRAIIRQA